MIKLLYHKENSLRNGNTGRLREYCHFSGRIFTDYIKEAGCLKKLSAAAETK